MGPLLLISAAVRLEPGAPVVPRLALGRLLAAGCWDWLGAGRGVPAKGQHTAAQHPCT